MAHSLSANKRIRQNASRQALSNWRKRRYRTAIKEYRETILHGTVEDAQKQLTSIYKLLDQIASTSTMHKKTASRYKSRLALSLNHKQTAATA